MRKAVSWMLLLATASLAPCMGAQKRIVAVAHEFPNYVFHLFTLGGIVPDPGYVKAYSPTLAEADRLCLESNKKELAWADGGTGSLTAAFLFLPGYINPRTQGEVEEYLDLLIRAIRTNDPAPMASRYRDRIEKTKAFVPFDLAPYLKSIAPQEPAVARIADIYRRNFPAYDREVWPVERTKIEAVAGKLNPELERRDFISRWEKLTGVGFKTDLYEIVLYTANARGSNANSLGYDRNTFYFAKDPAWMIQFLSHETGTHILIDIFNRLASTGKYPFPVAYKAYETMCEFYNQRFVLAGEKPLYNMSNYDDAKFLSLYNKIFDQNPGIGPADLLPRCLEAYLAMK